eukprot:482255-Rhodomonas_salina.1
MNFEEWGLGAGESKMQKPAEGKGISVVEQWMKDRGASGLFRSKSRALMCPGSICLSCTDALLCCQTPASSRQPTFPQHLQSLMMMRCV